MPSELSPKDEMKHFKKIFHIRKFAMVCDSSVDRSILVGIFPCWLVYRVLLLEFCLLCVQGIIFSRRIWQLSARVSTMPSGLPQKDIFMCKSLPVNLKDCVPFRFTSKVLHEHHVVSVPDMQSYTKHSLFTGPPLAEPSHFARQPYVKRCHPIIAAWPFVHYHPLLQALYGPLPPAALGLSCSKCGAASSRLSRHKTACCYRLDPRYSYTIVRCSGITSGVGVD